MLSFLRRCEVAEPRTFHEQCSRPNHACVPRYLGTMVLMMSGGTSSSQPSFRIWVLVLILLFFALCGLHLLGVQHEGGQSHTMGLAIVVFVALLIALTGSQKPLPYLALRLFPWAEFLLVEKPRLARPIRAPLRV